MTGGEPYDIRREPRRVRIIRTLIAAIVLRHVGYEGALAGWDLDEINWPKLPEWFPISDNAREEASRTYVAAENWPFT